MKLLLAILGYLFFVGCATQQEIIRPVSTEKFSASNAETQAPQKILKRKVAIARFTNETQYAKGIFYDKENDPIGNQALDILSAKLAESGKFILLERNDFDLIQEELELSGNQNLQKVGADYLIIGSVTKYGRKNTGDVNVFSRSKTQVVEAAVSVRLIDVSNGQIIYSEEAESEAETTSKTSFGLGERSGYDATLNDEAISIAISKLVENIINNSMDNPWKSYFLSYDQDAIVISGGENQGLEVGDIFDVMEKGKKVENPQTGMMIELPSKKVGSISVESMGGTTPENEYSLVSFLSGSIDNSQLSKYYVMETEK